MDTNKKEEKLVSIGIPTWNRSGLLRIALTSLLNQTHRNIEFIISDNASSDETQAMCMEFAAKDSRIRYIRQPRHMKRGYQNFIFVLRESKGDYFMWAGDDDWWAPTFVEETLLALTRTDCDLAFSGFEYAFDGGPFIKNMLIGEKYKFENKSWKEIFLNIASQKRGLDQIIYGLFRTPFARKVFYRRPINGRAFGVVLLSEIAVMGRLCSVQKVLRRVGVKKRIMSARQKNWKKFKLFIYLYRDIVFLACSCYVAARIIPSPFISARKKSAIVLLLLKALFRRRRRSFAFFYGDWGRLFRGSYWRNKVSFLGTRVP